MNEAATTGTVGQGSPSGLLRFILRLPIVLYHLRLGWVLGQRFLLLTYTGRKSGVARSTVLEVLRYDRTSGLCIIASGWGARSQWYGNVLNNPEVQYTIGLRRRVGCAEQLPVERAGQELQSYGTRHPTAIRKLNKLMIGEEFDGSAAQYRRLAAQVPVLQLTPNVDCGSDA